MLKPPDLQKLHNAVFPVGWDWEKPWFGDRAYEAVFWAASPFTQCTRLPLTRIPAIQAALIARIQCSWLALSPSARSSISKSNRNLLSSGTSDGARECSLSISAANSSVRVCKVPVWPIVQREIPYYPLSVGDLYQASN